MKFVEYLDNAARLRRKAAEIEEPKFKALLLRQAEVYQQLRNEKMGWANGPEIWTDMTPAQEQAKEPGSYESASDST
jgi:hypothetical protein